MKKGRLKVIAGPMFSGKSSELLISIKRSRIAGQNVILFNPSINTRDPESRINSRMGIAEDAISVNEKAPQDILSYVGDNIDIVAIDEVQFFDSSIIRIIEELINKGIRVVVAGLDTNYLGEPFGALPVLLAKADYVIKLTAVCVECAKNNCREVEATRTQFLGNLTSSDDNIIIGDKELYEARCRDCHVLPK